MSNADILKAAKRLLISCTWVQGDELAVSGPKDCFCAATAIGEAIKNSSTEDRGSYPSGDMHPAFDIFKNAAGIPLTAGIGTWNDAPERTKDEVLAAFDKAIALAEAA